MSIRYRISLYLAIVLLTGSFVLAGINSFSSYFSLKSQVDSGSTMAGKRYEYEISNFLNSVLGSLRGFQFMLETSHPNREEVIFSLKKLAETDAHFLGPGYCMSPTLLTDRMRDIKILPTMIPQAGLSLIGIGRQAN